MATRPIINIEVNDSEFAKFVAQFQSYATKLAATAGVWKQTNEAINAAGAGLDKVVEETEAAAEAAEATAEAINEAGETIVKVVDGAEATQEAAEATAEATATTVTNVQHTNMAFNNQVTIINQAGKAASEAGKHAKVQASYWQSMAKSSRSFAGHITDATRSLLRWASLTGLISGILGGGGLFGIDRLAISAGGQRRSSQGLGVSTGEQQAFATDYGRLVDPERTLGGVNEAMHDVNKRWVLNGLGLNTEGKDSAQVSVEMLNAVKKLTDQTPDSRLGQLMQQHGLDQMGLTLQDLQRLKAATPEEMSKYQSDYTKDAQAMNLPPGVLKAWQDFQVQLDRSGTKIKQTFIEGLAPLAPQMESISSSFADLSKALLNSPTVKQWIIDAADGMKTFAAYIGTPKFKQDVEDFAAKVGAIADAIGAAISTIYGWVTKFNDATGGGPAQYGPPVPGRGNTGRFGGPSVGDMTRPTPNPGGQSNMQLWEDGIINGLKGWLGLGGAQAAPAPQAGSSGSPTPSDPTGAAGVIPSAYRLPALSSPSVIRAAYQVPAFGSPATMPAAYRVPDMAGSGVVPAAFRPYSGNPTGGVSNAFLASVEYQESRGKDLTNAQSGAQGYFQFMPDTARQYGVDPHDEASSLDGARRMFADLAKQFGNDQEKMLAAYNWGSGNLQKDISTYGDRWKEHAPQETQNYISQILGRIAQAQAPSAGNRGGQKMEVNIHNNTGGNAAVAISQLAT